MNKQVAVTSKSFSSNSVLRAELEAQFPFVKFNETGKNFSKAELIAFLQGCEMAITALDKIDNDILSAVPQLKVISKYGVGLDMIDLDAMTKNDVQLGWTPGVNRRSVSELALAFMLSLLRKIPPASREVREGVWRQHVGGQLTGRTVGIVGCGHVGKDLISLLKPFQCRILACDIKDQADYYRQHSIQSVELPQLLSESDIVSLHVPLTTLTRNMLNGEALQLMKPGAILINTSRGSIVDEEELKLRLKDGRISAAGFDVFATEPPSDMDLLTCENFLASPHIGGSSLEAILAMGRAAIRGLLEHHSPSTFREFQSP